MCSWCWGFKPVLKQIVKELPANIKIVYLLGGLAADTNEPMPENMRAQIISTWHRIQETIPGTRFSYDFWEKCTPKRSTYLSCRAVLAAAKQNHNKSFAMIAAIQEAYYLHALNPSELSTLKNLAQELGLNIKDFNDDIKSEEINLKLAEEIRLSRNMGGDSFPSLVLNKNGKNHPIALDYNHADIILDHIRSFI